MGGKEGTICSFKAMVNSEISHSILLEFVIAIKYERIK